MKLMDPKKVRLERLKREAELYSESFRAFIEGAWEIVEPGSPFLPGFHIDAIAEHLQACCEGKIGRLLINMPPRQGKTVLTSILYPAWVWTRIPEERFLYGSYGLDLARDASAITRRLVKSEWYQERWPFIKLADDQDTKSNFANTLNGRRQITSVGGPTTGLGGTHLVMDDPINVEDAESAPIRETTLRWFREAFATRMNPGRQVRIVIMQRVHQGDVSGYCLAEGGWEHLCLPMEYEGKTKATSLGWSDPRTEPGELLWAERYKGEAGKKEIESLKTTMGSAAVAGQLQQRPVPRGGATFKNQWLYFWYDENNGAPPEEVTFPKDDGTVHVCKQAPLPKLDEGSVVNSWDLAFKGGEKNDFVVGQAWGRGIKDYRANHYLLDQVRGRFDFVETAAAVKRLAHGRYPPSCTLVEEKANGAAIIASLKTEIPALIAINPLGGKESRASGVAPMFEAANVWLPHPKMPGYEWVQGYIDELLMFPRGDHDDQVDATTQALIRLKERQIEGIEVALGALSNPWRV